MSGRAPRFVLPSGGMGIDGAWLAATAALYTAAGELLYQEEKPLLRPGVGCTRARSEASPAGAVVLIAIYLVSTAVLARRAAGAWVPRVAAHVFAAAFAGLALIEVYVGLRMETGAHCQAIELCAWCLEPAWYERGALFLAPALAGAAAAPLVGWVARLPRRRPAGRTTSIEKPEA